MPRIITSLPQDYTTDVVEALLRCICGKSLDAVIDDLRGEDIYEEEKEEPTCLRSKPRASQ